MKRSLAGVTSLALLAVPAAAVAAPPSGSYAGGSSGEFFLYGQEEPAVDKGRAAFSIRAGNVARFRLTGQRFQCGGPSPEVPISVKRIRLDSAGRGKATFTDPNVGPFTIAIRVTDRGRASGTVTPKGLCQSTVKFRAKRR